MTDSCPGHSDGRLERLAAGEVHIWRIDLDEFSPGCERDAKRARVVSVDEFERARRFCFEVDRQRFTAGRVALREILSRYAGIRPELLRFRYGPQGKPELAGAAVHFNASHSQSLALCAVAASGPVGIDVERLRSDISLSEIAQRFFSEREILAFMKLPARDRMRGFFDCWSRKEAYIKARGGGLSIPLDSFAVSFVPGEPAALIEDRSCGEARLWVMASLNIGEEYAAAIVARTPLNAYRVRNFRVDEDRSAWPGVRSSSEENGTTE